MQKGFFITLMYALQNNEKIICKFNKFMLSKFIMFNKMQATGNIINLLIRNLGY